MISLTLRERRIRRILIGRAQAAADPSEALIFYKDLYWAVPPELPTNSYPGNGQAWSRELATRLYHISTYEHEHGRPLLTVFVVHQSDGRVGDGFIKMARGLGHKVDDEQAFWAAGLAAVVDFWSDADPTRTGDALLERVMGELQVVRSRLRALEATIAKV